MLKVNLHFHSGEDPRDFIPYSFYEGVDCAAAKGFDALALTCHQKFVFKEEFQEYGKKRRILIIPGIELSLEKWKHVVVLNCKKDIEDVSGFNALRVYKKRNPRIFVLAPHPFFPTNVALKKSLRENIDLFDAIEMSWFWTQKTDFNKKAREAALKYDKPYLATSDTHSLKYLDRAYALVDAKEKNAEAIFEAIKNNKFKNFSLPLKKRELLKAEALILRCYFGGRFKNFKNAVLVKKNN